MSDPFQVPNLNHWALIRKNSGIGLALTAALFQTGAKKVYILGRRIETLKTGAQTVDPSLKTVIPVQCDITSTSSINACVQQIKTDVDYIDVLINNAGITGPGHKDIYSATTLEDVAADLLKQPEEWESTMATNTTAINFVSASFLRLLDAGNVRRGYESGKVEGRARTRDPTIGKANGVDETDERSSQIISVTSISAFNRHITAGLAYTASKAGATLIGKTLATLLAPWGIRSNVISPGSKFSPSLALPKRAWRF